MRRQHAPPRLALPLLALVVAMLASLAPPPAAARPAAAPSAEAGSPIPCSASPFGGVIELGAEEELFLGFTVNDVGAPGSLGVYRFDEHETIDFIQEDDLLIDSANGRSVVNGRVGAAADLNGDGRSEFVQSFTDASGRYQLAAYGQGETLTDFIDADAASANHSLRAIAGGDFLGRDDGREQVAVASRSPSGALVVQIFDGGSAGGIGAKAALWRSTTDGRSQASQLKIAAGNLDNDGYLDIVVAIVKSNNLNAQLIYLEYDPGHQAGSGDNIAQSLRLRAFAEVFANRARSIRLDMADLNGDSYDELIYAYESSDGSPTTIELFRYNLVGAALARVTNRSFGTGKTPVAMATGDIDGLSGGVRQEEIILAFESDGAFGFGPGLHIQALRLSGLSGASPQLESISYIGDGNEGRRFMQHIELAVADLDKDNRGEIVAAFKDENQFGFQIALFEYQTSQNPRGLRLVDSGRYDATLTAPISLAAADWDDNSLKGRAQGRCEQVTEYHVSSAVFVPPYWRNIQGDQEKAGSIGQSRTTGSSVEKSITYSYGHAASAYVGVGAGISIFDIVELGASVRATASREYSTSNRRASSNTSEETQTTGVEFSDDGVVYSPADYKCYSYQLYEEGLPLPADEAAVRLCEYIPLPGTGTSTALTGSGLDSWDRNRSGETEYVPVARDWASLALFRGPNTAQSSNGATAARAVDSEVVGGSFVGGPLAETISQANPWWQVDLGSLQDLTKIRIWAPPASLDNYVVLVGEGDFRQIPGHENPANLIGKPGVRAYTPAALGLPADAPAGEVTTLLTLDGQGRPARGRFVRVQRTDTAALRLAEVQVFGPNHVDPDRYPLAVAEEIPNDPTSRGEQNGFFAVQLYNPFVSDPQLQFPWVKVRGQLRWDGTGSAGIPTLLAGRGGPARVVWGRSTSTGGTQLTAEGSESNSSVGVEFDVEAGVVVKVQGGGGFSTTSGVAEETVFSSSWSAGLELGGALPSFPESYDGPQQAWADRCQYGVQPYFYELTDESSLGFAHSYTVLDYVVLDGSNNASLLDRREDLSACRNGNLVAATPQASSDSVSTLVGSQQKFAPLANDRGGSLRITSVGPAQNGQTSFSERSISYTPNGLFTGTDSFSYTVTDGQGQSSTATITVEVRRHQLFMPLALR